MIPLPMSLPFSPITISHYRSSICFYSLSLSSSSSIPKSLIFPSSNSGLVKMTDLTCFSTCEGPTMTSSSDPLQVKPKPWLIVGLGNPGKKYAGTRHNVGFEMVDTIADAEGITISSVSFKASVGKGFIGNVPVILSKPQTFMNVSGECVGSMVSYYKIPLQQVLLIYDDLDLPFAKLRLLPKGGHGGHNGMRSVIDHFKGNRNFPRLRIGIGRPPGQMDPASFVLQPFTEQERNELDFTLQNGLKAMRILLLDGFHKSATFVNSFKPSGTTKPITETH